jgi:hypothetical protein
MAKKVSDLFDLVKLRAQLMEDLVRGEKMISKMAKEIGITHNTLRTFLTATKIPRVNTAAKMINYVNKIAFANKKLDKSDDLASS